MKVTLGDLLYILLRGEYAVCAIGCRYRVVELKLCELPLVVGSSEKSCQSSWHSLLPADEDGGSDNGSDT